MSSTTFHQLRSKFIPHGVIYTVLSIVIVALLVLTTVFGIRSNKTQDSTADDTTNDHYRIIGYPIRLRKGDRSVQWTILQMNDVYEILALDGGRKGGLARVAKIREMLKEENPNTLTILAGDFLSPSALGLSRVNGSALNGRQMVATLNVLGLDFVTFGNHEFDINRTELLARMNESEFKWISSNIFEKDTRNLFGRSISHEIVHIDGVRILFIGLTIDGTGSYVDIVNQSSLVDYVQEFLKRFPSGTYDVLVALTHVDMQTDVQLASRVPQIDLILGGHEHENYHYLRGVSPKPIFKADGNAFSVYVHRCLFNPNTKEFNVFSTLSLVDSRIEEEKRTALIGQYWFDLGMKAFESEGYTPTEIVSCLPDGIELDGRSQTVRSSITSMTLAICNSVLYITKNDNTVVGLMNGGGVRVDDILRGSISQYDVLRTLPFVNYIVSFEIDGDILARVLTQGSNLKGNGMFLAYVGIETKDDGKTWLINNMDISKTGLSYRVAANDFLLSSTELNQTKLDTRRQYNVTQARGFIDYMKITYPPC